MSNGAIKIIIKVMNVTNNKELMVDIKKYVVSPTLFDLKDKVATISEEFFPKCK